MHGDAPDHTFRWGILGSGRMASVFARELALHPEACLAAVASHDRGRAAAFARERDIPRWFETYESLIACDEVDIVYDASTNNYHLENGLNCLMYQKPVLVEKPICQNTAELDELTAVFHEQRSFCMEAMWTRFFPLIRGLKERLEAIGPLTSMAADFGIDVPFDPTHRLYNPALGGGALLDLGVYPITLAHVLFGLKGCEVASFIERAETGVDETSTIHLTYPDGLTVRLFCSASKKTPHVAVFQGENGTAVLEDFFHPSRLEIQPDQDEPTVIEPTYPHMGYHFQIDEVHRALSAGAVESELMPLAYSHEVLALIDHVLSSG